MKIKNIRLGRLGIAFAFVLAVVVAQFAHVQLAFAATTATWTGTSGDGKFSTAGNWTGNTLPTTGDTIAFNNTSLSANTVLNNDMSGLSVGGINYLGTNTTYGYTINGNALTLTGDISNTATGPYVWLNLGTNIVLGANIATHGLINFSGLVDTQTYNISLNDTAAACMSVAHLAGSGAVSINSTSAIGLGAGNTGFSGSISIASGTVIANNTAAFGTGSVTISGSGELSLYAPANSTWTTPFTLGGSGWIGAQHGSTNGCSGGSDSSVYMATLSGPVALSSDFSYNGGDNMTIAGTYTANGHAFTVGNGVSGTLTLPTGTVVAPVVTNTYSDSQPSQNVSLGTGETGILDGTRKQVNVNAGGTLMGTGTAESLYIAAGGTVAPGHSPGKLTVTQTFSIDGVYQAQLKDSADGDYDQVQVSDPSRTTGNDVSINSGATLDVSLYAGWDIKQGDTFTIIKNLQPSTQTVNGTFNGLAEGAQFTVSGITFSISYVGGDGNDVVLTALNTGTDPTPPNTGFTVLKLANPIVLVGLGVVSAGILFALARRRLNR
ncbi:MAG: hypothetical protein ABIP50_01025 [Candidatus Saccharimonadales bacterium]